jgi:hypothetical protein
MSVALAVAAIKVCCSVNAHVLRSQRFRGPIVRMKYYYVQRARTGLCCTLNTVFAHCSRFLRRRRGDKKRSVSVGNTRARKYTCTVKYVRLPFVRGLNRHAAHSTFEADVAASMTTPFVVRRTYTQYRLTRGEHKSPIARNFHGRLCRAEKRRPQHVYG